MTETGRKTKKPPLLELRNICTCYGNIQVLFDLNIRVGEGEIAALLGRNAAGKTTTMSTIMGLVRASSGEIIYDGEDITSMDTSAIVRRGVMIVPEGRRIFPEMTVLENLQMGAFLRKKDGTEGKDLEYVFGLFPRLKERSKQTAGTMSGGEQQMLAIGRALMGRPRLLLLDEPSMGLAPVLVEQVFETIKQINSAGTTIFLVEQNASMALETSQYAYVLEKGSIVTEGESGELMAKPEIQKAYLGG